MQTRRSLRLLQQANAGTEKSCNSDNIDDDNRSTKDRRKQRQSLRKKSTKRKRKTPDSAQTNAEHGRDTNHDCQNVKSASKSKANEQDLLLDLGKLVKGRLVKRPSASVRSPYVSDVLLLNQKNDNDGGAEVDKIVLAHSPALDVGGLCVPGTIVYMTERPPGGKTSHSIELIVAPPPHSATVEHDNDDGINNGVTGVLVGSHPSLGEKLAEEALKRGLLKDVIGYGPAELQQGTKKKNSSSVTSVESVIPRTELKRQRTYGDSRVDFEIVHTYSADEDSPLTDENENKTNMDDDAGPASKARRTLVEVKNVVCSDVAESLAPKKTGPNHCVIIASSDDQGGDDNGDGPPKSTVYSYTRTAIFPWGRVGQTFDGKKVVSERAIKHLRNLAELTSTGVVEDDGKSSKLDAVVLFVINRADCENFRPCHEQCPVFAKELKSASDKGCIVTSFRVRWTIEGKAYFDGIVPVTLC